MPDFVGLLVDHRPSCAARRCPRPWTSGARQPGGSPPLFQMVAGRRSGCTAPPPSLVFAVIGQARADGKLSPEDEADLLARLLTHWAMRSTLDMSASAARLHPRSRLGVITRN